ncbi:MAG: arginase family protein [Candidatus Hodarchaeota archaeon]
MFERSNLIPSSLSFLCYPSIKPESLEHYEGGIIGIPSDLGATQMSGSRYAPHEIRIASQQYTGYLSAQKKNISEAWIGDLGNLDVNTCQSTIAFVKTAQSTFQTLAQYQKPLISIGGDHLTTYCAVSGLKEELKNPPAILWLDAHLDFDDEYPTGVKYSHATVLRRLKDSKCMDPYKSVVLGYRGYASHEISEKEAHEAGINIFSMHEIRKQGFSTTLEQVKKILTETSVYVSIDIDVLDCAYAPGTGVHEPGGFTPWELLEIIRLIDVLKTKVIGADIVEVNPLRDPTRSTCSIAAVILLELLGVILNT